MELSNPPILTRLAEALDDSVRQQKIISSNLANVDTPGYRARRLDFDHALSFEVEGDWMATEADFSKPVLLRREAIEYSQDGSEGNDLNNVDADFELTQLAQNLLKFSVVSEIYRGKLQGIKYAISEGRG